MTNKSLGSPKGTIDKDSAELIAYLAKRKYKYFSVCLIIGIISSIIIKFYVLGYKATGSFFVNDQNALSSANVDLRIVDNLTPSDNFNRIFQQAVSTTVQNHLISKFNLVKHYGVDSTKEFYFQRTGNILKSNISVTKSPYNTILITVQDRYRYLAADMANEIMAYIDILNRDYFIKNLEQKLKISESFLSEVEKDNSKKSRSIDSLLQEVHHLATISERPTSTAIQIEQTLGSLINELTYSTHDLMNSQKLYNLLLQSLNRKNYETITVVQSAMPAPRSNIFDAIIYGILITFALFCILVFRAYLKLEFSYYINLLFAKRQKES